MHAHEYLVVPSGNHWEVRVPGKLEPLATYEDIDDALAYAYQAAWMKQVLDGVPSTVRRLSDPGSTPEGSGNGAL